MKPPPISEAEFLSQILELARLHGWRTAHFRPARLLEKNGASRWRTAVSGQGKGFPDLVLVRRGKLIFAEVKRSRREKPTPEQTEWLEALGLVDGIVVRLWVPEDWAVIEALLT